MIIKNLKFKIYNLNAGQSLFEIVLAVGLIALVLFALTSLMAQGQKNASKSKDISDRSRAVSDATEWLRNQRDTDWAEFYSHSSNSGQTYCLNTLDWNTNSACNSLANGQSYSRQAVLIRDNSDPTHNTVKADVSVSWTDTQGSHTQTFTTYLTNWKEQ